MTSNLITVEGDPEKEIRDLHMFRLVMKSGMIAKIILQQLTSPYA